MKIGILTYHSSHNYGAFLQAYALSHALSERTKNEVEIINYSMSKASRVNKNNIWFNKRHLKSLAYNLERYKMFNVSINKYHKLSTSRLESDNLLEFCSWVDTQDYDAIIVGSDEVWKLDGYRGFPNPYWLPGVLNCKKLSYAASSRTEDKNISPEVRNEISHLLESFSYIGVRDIVTKNLIEDIVGSNKQCHLNCDPTFAYDFIINKDSDKWFVQKKFRINSNKKCIALMIGVPDLAYQIIKRYKNKYDFISLYNYYEGTKGYAVLDPFEWIRAISGVDGLITTFYHGMLFAIKADTPFLAIENRKLGKIEYSKSYDLLYRYKLTNDRFSNIDDKELFNKIENLFLEIEDTKNEQDFSHIRQEERKLFDSFLEELK